jgi:hypothetical protein
MAAVLRRIVGVHAWAFLLAKVGVGERARMMADEDA